LKSNTSEVGALSIFYSWRSLFEFALLSSEPDFILINKGELLLTSSLETYSLMLSISLCYKLIIEDLIYSF